MRRNWFFWMEALQITAAERRVVLGLVGMLLVVTGTRTFYPGRTIYDDQYYEPVIAEFTRLSGIREEERRVLLARYYPPEETQKPRALQFGLNLPETPMMSGATGETTAAAEPGEASAERQQERTGTRSPPASGDGRELRVNIQLAGLDELVLLPGIGPVTAGRILAYREENGPFRTPEDLLNVSGIGPRTLENIREFIIFEQEPDLVPEPDQEQMPASKQEQAPEQDGS